jgi:hypothetical protein
MTVRELRKWLEALEDQEQPVVFDDKFEFHEAARVRHGSHHGNPCIVLETDV